MRPEQINSLFTFYLGMKLLKLKTAWAAKNHFYGPTMLKEISLKFTMCTVMCTLTCNVVYKVRTRCSSGNVPGNLCLKCSLLLLRPPLHPLDCYIHFAKCSSKHCNTVTLLHCYTVTLGYCYIN